MRSSSYAFFLIVLFLLQVACSPISETPPNILIIIVDDLGWNDVSYHGSDIQTPEIDKLAEEGIQLNRFYTCPKCTPTRVGLLTGRYPNRFGLRYGVCSPWTTNGLPPEEITIAEYLAENGYQNRAAFGKWHLGHSHVKYHPLNQGFTYFYGHYNGAIDYFTRKRDAELDWHRNFDPVFEDGYSTDLIGEDVIRYISEIDKNEPFFAYVAFNAPHSPMQAKEQDLLKYGYDPDQEPEQYAVGGMAGNEREKDIYGMRGRGNNLRQTFSGMVNSLDQQIGNILNYLKENDLYDNTIIWFLSDNGGVNLYGGDNKPLRGQKHTEWEGGVRTVSVVKPDFDTQTKQIDQLVSYIDIYPTIASMIEGNDTDVIFDGADVSLSFDGKELPERYLYLGNNALVSDQWKLVQDQLFKIDSDFTESTNVSENFQEKFEELKEKVEDFKSIEQGKYTVQPEGWLPPENWKIPDE